MEAPYNKEDLELIHSLVIGNVDAPEDWSTFPIIQVGRAKTYQEGLKKIEKMKSEDHVLTLESVDSASEAQRQLTAAVKRRKLQAEAGKFHAQFSLDNKAETKIDEFPNKNKTETCFDKIDKDESSTKVIEVLCGEPELASCSKATNFALEPQIIIANTSPIPKSTSSAAINLKNYSDLGAKDSFISDVPIVNINSIEYKSDFEAAVMMKLEELSHNVAIIMQRQDDIANEIASLKVAQNATSNFLSDKKFVGKSLNFETKYEIMVPIATYEDFETFEKKLKTDKFFKKDYLELRSLADKDYAISKSIVKMLKRFLTKDLAKQFTAIRTSAANKNKHKFKLTELCTMIEAVITKLRSEKSLKTQSEDFNSSLTDVFTNVTKWK